MGLFKKKNGSDLNFADLDGLPLKEGDRVLSLRYDLGECLIIKEGKGFAYQSEKTGKTVGWSRMIDAATKNQKVRKIL